MPCVAICEGPGLLGIELKESSNAQTAGAISTDASRVTVRVIRTDEDPMIARSAKQLLETGAANKKE
jgi:acetate kinase